MKKFSVALCAILAASLSMAGCIGQQTIHTSAYGPTEEEARMLAKAELDQQASGHKVMTNVKYKTQVLSQNSGGQVYQVTASERVK